MSGAGPLVGGLVGAGVGFAIGGPAGAQFGFVVGAMAGRMIENEVSDVNDSFTTESLGGIDLTSVNIGKMQPLIWGTDRVAGNIIWNSPRVSIETRTEGTAAGGKGGFGGPSAQPATSSITYRIDLAIGISGRPIESVKRIWADATLIFDDSNQDNVTIVAGTPTGDISPTPLDEAPVKIAQHADSAQEFILFRGTEVQEPSSHIETFEGVGNVPGYRGVAYMLMKNLDLGSLGRVPNFTFEVAVGKDPGNEPVDVVAAAGQIIIVYPNSTIEASAASNTLAIIYNSFDIEPTLQLEIEAAEPLQIEPGTVNESAGAYILQDDQTIASMLTSGGVTQPGHPYRTAQEIEFEIDLGVQSFRMQRIGSAVQIPFDLAVMTLDTNDEAMTAEFDSSDATAAPVIKRVTTAANPKDAWHNVNQSGFFYVSCSGAGVVQRWSNFQFGSLLDTITVGNNPTELIEAPVNARMWVCNTNDDTVQHFITAGDVSAPIAVGVTPTAMAIATDDFLWVLNSGTPSSVTRILSSSPFTVQGTFLLPGSGSAIIAGINNDVWVSDLVNNKVYRVESDGTITTSTVPRGPTRMAVDSNSGDLYVISPKARTFTRINADATIAQTPENRNGLACVVRQLNELAGLSSNQIDVDGLDNTPVNMSLLRLGAARIPLENLATAFGFLGIESNGTLKYFFKGGTPIATIPEASLAAKQDEPGEESLVIKRLQEIEVPNKVTVVHRNALRNYQQDTQNLQNGTIITPVNPIVVNTPIVLDSIQARNLSEVLLYEAIQGRTGFSFKLPHKFALIEPGDIIDITSRGVQHRLRVTSMVQNQRGELEFEGIRHRSFIYQDFVGVPGDALEGGGVIGQTDVDVVFVDAPPLNRNDTQGARYFSAFESIGVGVFQPTTLYESVDNQATFQAIKTVFIPAIVGSALSVLAAGPPNIFDEANTVDIRLSSESHQLDTLSELEVLNGSNMASLGSEILFFRTATLIAARTYRLSNLIRGRRGTESLTGSHSLSEDFVLLDAVVQSDMLNTYDPARFEVQADFKVVPTNVGIDQVTAVQFTPLATALKSWAPVLRAPVRDVPATLDWTINWLHRSRQNGDWLNLVGISYDADDAKFYTVTIYTSAFTIPKRIFTTPVFPVAEGLRSQVYTVAEQVEDFGGAQAIIFFGITQHVTSTIPGFEIRAASDDF